MDKTNNLQYFLTDIADAIREKKGTTDLINAQSFADEIKNLPQSGGGTEGGIQYEYIVIEKPYNEVTFLIILTADILKDTYYDKVILPAGIYIATYGVPHIQNNSSIGAVAYNFSKELSLTDGSQMTMKDYLLANGITEEQISALPRITKEEFYNFES